MSPGRSRQLLAPLMLAICGLAHAQSPPQNTLSDQLAQLASDKANSGARLNYVVIDLHSGEVVAQRDPDTLVPVASNVKLVTSAAALYWLGLDYRFATRVLVTKRNGGRADRLYLQGFGDPTLGLRHLWQLANQLYESGLRRVKRLYLDEGYFDAQRLAPLYDSSDTDAYYRAPTGALSLHENTVAIRVSPGKTLGDALRVVTRPRSDYFRVINRGTTTDATQRPNLRIKTRAGARRTTIVISGRLRLEDRGQWQRRRISHPGQLFGSVLLDLLRQRGIRVGSRHIWRGPAPQSAQQLAEHRSRPLPNVLRYMNKRSNNFVAEQVLKVLGATHDKPPGSSRKGVAAVAAFLDTLGIHRGQYQLKNGAGLYEGNRLSARQLAHVLRHMARNFRLGAEYVSTLPVAGTDGTLGHRLQNSGAETYIRAKTGTLGRVVSLSGLAGASRPGPVLIFSFVLSELPSGRIPAARRSLDRMAHALVAHLEAKTADSSP